jgi:hypothetical protein
MRKEFILNMEWEMGFLKFGPISLPYITLKPRPESIPPAHPASDEIGAGFKMPPNPGPSEGICESLDEIDRLLEEENDAQANH